jgi:Icc-related predicted phosphoesterase
MNVLTIADEVVPAIYSLSIKERFSGAQLVLGCGDLPYYYMEFVVTTLGLPAYFVHGNHDTPQHLNDGTIIDQPRGWTNLEGRSVCHEGLLIAGLGGSIRYQPKGEHQYSQREMMARALLLAPKLLLNRRRYGRYLDVLISHSPPHAIQDGSDYAHKGFHALRFLIERFEPRYMVHGHVHRSYGFSTPFETPHGPTLVINTAGYRMLQLSLQPLDMTARQSEQESLQQARRESTLIQSRPLGDKHE